MTAGFSILSNLLLLGLKSNAKDNSHLPESIILLLYAHLELQEAWSSFSEDEAQTIILWVTVGDWEDIELEDGIGFVLHKNVRHRLVISIQVYLLVRWWWWLEAGQTVSMKSYPLKYLTLRPVNGMHLKAFKDSDMVVGNKRRHSWYMVVLNWLLPTSLQTLFSKYPCLNCSKITNVYWVSLRILSLIPYQLEAAIQWPQWILWEKE